MRIGAIALGADHAGWKLKETIARYLRRRGYAVEDLGTKNPDHRVDYPDFARSVAKAVSSKRARWGLLSCGTGIGMSIAANKIKGIRAAVAWDQKSAALAREHNDANILCLGGGILTSSQGLDCLKAFIRAEPSKESRHKNRIKKIHKLEQKG